MSKKRKFKFKLQKFGYLFVIYKLLKQSKIFLIFF